MEKWCKTWYVQERIGEGGTASSGKIEAADKKQRPHYEDGKGLQIRTNINILSFFRIWWELFPEGSA